MRIRSAINHFLQHNFLLSIWNVTQSNLRLYHRIKKNSIGTRVQHTTGILKKWGLRSISISNLCTKDSILCWRKVGEKYFAQTQKSCCAGSSRWRLVLSCTFWCNLFTHPRTYKRQTFKPRQEVPLRGLYCDWKICKKVNWSVVKSEVVEDDGVMQSKIQAKQQWKWLADLKLWELIEKLNSGIVMENDNRPWPENYLNVTGEGCVYEKWGHASIFQQYQVVSANQNTSPKLMNPESLSLVQLFKLLFNKVYLTDTVQSC